MKKTTTSIICSLSLLATPSLYSANLLLLVGGDQLSSFDTSIGAGSRKDVAVTGLSASDRLVGIDYRPATGVTYGISSDSNIYTIDTSTGQAAQLASTLAPALNGSSFGFDYNPAFMGGQFARIISDQNNNRVIDGDNGGYLGSVEKTAVFYAFGDVNEGTNPNINHIAYTNSVFGATSTQQYGIDSSLDILTTVANNAGTLETVGGLGIDASDLGGFDIDGASGEAFAAFPNGDGTSTIYGVDLTTGSATSLFDFSGEASGLTSVPEPSCAMLLGLCGIGLLVRKRR